MKTYQAVIEKPILQISYDGDTESPRHDSNLGYFITIDKRYNSPDDQDGTMFNIVKSTSEEANNQAHHMELIKEQVKAQTGEKVLAIYPVVKYEHSSVSYSLGTIHGFDHSNNGFYIVTDKTQKELGVKKADFEKIIKSELKIYTSWANGEIYCFTLYGHDGEWQDSCSGFYDIEDIREVLPSEWKNEYLTKYLN